MKRKIPPGTFLKFLLPVALWLFLFKDFLTRRALVSEDTFAIYGVLKYYLDNIKTGVFPFWNPFSLWGMGHISQLGEFNPAWFLVLFLNAIGVNFYHAFLSTVLLYYFLGLAGFYLLVKKISGNTTAAYAGFLLLMFSSVGMTLFVQLTLLMILVPSIGFFYFLAEFRERKTVGSFLCLVFCGMVILSTYIPFYFVTVFLSFLILWGMVYFADFKREARDFARFFKAHKGLAVLAVFSLGISLVPLFMTWISLKTDFLPLARPLVLKPEEIKEGLPIIEVMRDVSLFSLLFDSLRLNFLSHCREIFSWKTLTYGNQRIFYIPIFAHIVLWASAWLVIKKKSFLLAVLCFFIFVVSLVLATPIYPFLYRNVFFFKMFRNIFFLTPFVVALYVMLASQQFKDLLAEKNLSKRKNLAAFLAVLVFHAGFFVFLRSQPNILVSSCVTLVGSLVFWLLYFFGILRPERWLFQLFLFALIVIQPVEVFRIYTASAVREKSSIIARSVAQNSVRPVFSYTRPRLDQKDYASFSDNDIYRQFNWHLIAMKDSPGFFSYGYGYPTRRSWILSKSIPADDLNQYIPYKFFVYDQVRTAADEDINFTQLARDLRERKNVATVAPDNAENVKGTKAPAPRAQVIDTESGAFKILRFTANGLTVRTNFAENKFLVYNDSFHPFWRVAVNHKKSVLYRANFAFKGVWLPAGENVVTFRFSPPGGEALPFFILGFFFLFFIVSVTLYAREISRKI